VSAAINRAVQQARRARQASRRFRGNERSLPLSSFSSGQLSRTATTQSGSSGGIISKEPFRRTGETCALKARILRFRRRENADANLFTLTPPSREKRSHQQLTIFLSFLSFLLFPSSPLCLARKIRLPNLALCIWLFQSLRVFPASPPFHFPQIHTADAVETMTKARRAPADPRKKDLVEFCSFAI